MDKDKKKVIFVVHSLRDGGAEKVAFSMLETIDHRIYDLHVPMLKEDIIDAHKSVGLRIDCCEIFIFLNFGVINVESLHAKKKV